MNKVLQLDGLANSIFVATLQDSLHAVGTIEILHQEIWIVLERFNLRRILS